MSLWGKNRLLVGNSYTNSILTLTSTSGLFVGMPVSGNNVPDGAYVLRIINSTAVNTTATTADTSNGTYTFWEPPKNSVFAGQGSNAQGNVLFNNATPSAFVNNQVDGVFAVTASSFSASPAIYGYATGGWHAVRRGTGPVLSLAASNGGTPWGNLGLGLISGGTVNTTFIVTTNSTGGITALTLGANGGGAGFFSNGYSIATPSNSVITANVSVRGKAYNNSDTVRVSNASPVVNAAFSIGTNAMGAITSLTLTSGGRKFSGVAGEVLVTIISAGANSIGTVTISAGGDAYTNGDILKVTNTSSSVTNASFTVSTNTTGGISSLTTVVAGKGFDGNASHVAFAVTNSTGGTTSGDGTATFAVAAFNGVGATIVANSTSFKAGSTDTVFTPTFGGRADRVHRETLVALHLAAASNTP